MTIELATPGDLAEIEQIFHSYIKDHLEYYSHGDIQMGVALRHDGVNSQAPGWEEKWRQYYLGMFEDNELNQVFKAVDSGKILGYTFAQVFTDDDAPYGMVSDILVSEQCRKGGVGTALLDAAVAWLTPRCPNGIFLESGVANHAAHSYFRHYGFEQVSEVYMLKK